jgi:hypothetical protein
MRLRVFFTAFGLTALFAVLVALPAFATHGGDTRVTVDSPPSPFSQNKQNEPAVAVDANHPNILVAGANDNIDMEACNAGVDNECPFTEGVGVSGVYFSFDEGDSWTQPTYEGLTARHCLGVPGDTDPDCDPHPGPIGTLPNYYEHGLVSDGDPALAFGPKPDADGDFSWGNGSRLYYANLTSNLPEEEATTEEEAFKGFEAIAVSRTDDVRAAAAGSESAWEEPVIVSKQNSALISDKEQIWADNAASSPNFGNVYICNVGFRSSGLGGAPEPVLFARSTDGGDTWTTHQLSAATNNNQTGGRQGCAIRTDSDGVVYVFWVGTDIKTRGSVMYVARSLDGGRRFERPRIATRVTEVGRFDPATDRFSFDGVAAARTSTFPSVDIANGAPSGADATDEILLAWPDGPTPSDEGPGPNEQALVKYSLDKAETWSAPVNAALASDRPNFPAIAISPDGKDAYITYDNFLQPWQSSALAPPRLMEGVVRHADIAANGSIGPFTDLHRGPQGDARGSSQNNLAAEFLGDYNYAVATREYGAAVWNDVRNAAACPAIDTYRQELVDAIAAGSAEPQDEDLPEVRNEGQDRDQAQGEDPPEAPDVQQECPATFGNSDIYGGSYADPSTP